MSAGSAVAASKQGDALVSCFVFFVRCKSLQAKDTINGEGVRNSEDFHVTSIGDFGYWHGFEMWYMNQCKYPGSTSDITGSNSGVPMEISNAAKFDPGAMHCRHSLNLVLASMRSARS